MVASQTFRLTPLNWMESSGAPQSTIFRLRNLKVKERTSKHTFEKKNVRNVALLLAGHEGRIRSERWKIQVAPRPWAAHVLCL